MSALTLNHLMDESRMLVNGRRGTGFHLPENPKDCSIDWEFPNSGKPKDRKPRYISRVPRYTATKKCHRAIDIDSADCQHRNLCAMPCKSFNRGIVGQTELY